MINWTASVSVVEAKAVDKTLSGAKAQTAHLPEPDVLAVEIVDDLEAALEQFRAIAEDLEEEGHTHMPLTCRRPQGSPLPARRQNATARRSGDAGSTNTNAEKNLPTLHQSITILYIKVLPSFIPKLYFLCIKVLLPLLQSFATFSPKHYHPFLQSVPVLCIKAFPYLASRHYHPFLHEKGRPRLGRGRPSTTAAR